MYLWIHCILLRQTFYIFSVIYFCITCVYVCYPYIHTFTTDSMWGEVGCDEHNKTLSILAIKGMQVAVSKGLVTWLALCFYVPCILSTKNLVCVVLVSLWCGKWVNWYKRYLYIHVKKHINWHRIAHKKSKTHLLSTCFYMLLMLMKPKRISHASSLLTSETITKCIVLLWSEKSAWLDTDLLRLHSH